MKKILKLYGIPDKVIEQIHCMYLGSRSQVRVDGELSHSFSIDTGVLQGDTLAPFLFVIMVDYIMKLADKQCTCHGVIYKGRVSESTRSSSRATIESVKHLEFADDIVT